MKRSLNVLKMKPGFTTVNVFYKVEASGAIGVHEVRRQKVVKLRPDIAAHREKMVRLRNAPDLRELRPLAGGPAAIFDAAHQPRLSGANYVAGDRRRRAKSMKPVVEQPKPLSRRQKRLGAAVVKAAQKITHHFAMLDECQQVAG